MVRKAAAIVTIGLALLTIAGCGGGGSAKPVPPRPSRTFSQEQLRAMLLTDADVPGTTINKQEESSDITASEEDKVSGGSAGCQKFVDATELIASAYGTTAQVSRDLLGATGFDIRYDLTLAALPGSGAQQVMADLRSGLSGCTSTYTMTWGAMTGSSTETDIHVGALGDTSIGWSEVTSLDKADPATAYVEFVQVGPVVVDVRAYAMTPGAVDPKKLQSQLATVAQAQVGKLEAAWSRQ